jgi:hypothetical protein
LKILIYSRVFWPGIGDLETMMEILAEEFTVAEHQVKVATQIASEVERDPDYEVERLPTLKSRVPIAALVRCLPLRKCKPARAAANDDGTHPCGRRGI